MKVVEYYYQFFKKCGINKAFGVPGSYIMPLWQQFCEPEQVELILARHENGAVFMADGWSRENKKVGIVLTTIGPGITNAITGIAAAYYDSVPLIIISGYSAVRDINKGGFQNSKVNDRGFSAKSLLQEVTKAVFIPKNAEEAVQNLMKAYEIAQEGRKGPVHILIPKDVQLADYEQSTVKSLDLSTREFLIEESVFEKIENAKRPILFSGWGCFLADAQYDRDKFVNEYKIPFICSTKGLAGGQKVERSLFWGVTGTITRQETIDKIKEYHPELWIVVGSSMSLNSFMELGDVCDSEILQVDIDRKQQNQYRKADIFCECDAKYFFKELLKRGNLNKTERCYSKTTEPVPVFFFEKVLESLFHKMPVDTILVPDAGNHWLEALYWFPNRMKFDIRTNAGLASMGHAIGAAIGMKMANEEKEVVCLTGDGSFLMSGMEISVAVQHKIKLLFIVYDNRSLGRVRVGQSLTGKYIASDIDNVSIEEIASGLGAKTAVIDSVVAFEYYLDMYHNSNEVWVLNVVEKEDIIPAFLRERGTIN